MKPYSNKYSLRISNQVLFFVSSCVSTLVACHSKTSNNDSSNCRSYATQYAVITSTAEVEDKNPTSLLCTFDSTSLEFTCTGSYTSYSMPQTHVIVRSYSSIDDFVQEAKVPGKVFWKESKQTNSAYGYIAYQLFGDGLNQFDESKRLIATNDRKFISWDDAGRPKTSNPRGICTNEPGAQMTYDDEARSMRIDYSTRTSTQPGDGTIPCIAVQGYWIFDLHGNLTEFGNKFGKYASYEVIAEEQICK